MTGAYTPDYRGIRSYLNNSPQLRKELHRRAILGLGVAVGLAPRRTNALASSGEVVFDGSDQGKDHDRMQYSIQFTVHYAVPVTFPKRFPDARDYLRAAIPIIERG